MKSSRSHRDSFCVVSSFDSKNFGFVHFAVVFGDRGLLGTTFPETNRRALLATIEKRFPRVSQTSLDKAPAFVSRAIEKMRSAFDGRKASFDRVPLDFSDQTEFIRSVYQAARAIPAGQTVSYGELAAIVGRPGGARAVGQAMARNPFPLIVPCHRVLAGGRALGGFTAPGGLETKRKLLRSEGVRPPTAKSYPRGIDPVRILSERDPRLARLIRELGPFRLTSQSVGGEDGAAYSALFRSILFQQLNGKAAQTILDRVKSNFGGRLPTPAEFLAADPNSIRAAGVSRNKFRALSDLATKTQDGVVPELSVLRRMDDEEIVRQLTAIRGVGRWTVEMLLLFRLRRPDVFPVDDFAIRVALTRFLGRSQPIQAAEAEAIAEPWRPFRSVVSWYLWRSLDAREKSSR